MNWWRLLTAAELLAMLGLLNLWRMHMSAALDRLKASVDLLNSKADDLITLANTLIAAIRNTPNVDAELSALADKADAEIAEIQGAIDADQPPTT